MKSAIERFNLALNEGVKSEEELELLSYYATREYEDWLDVAQKIEEQDYLNYYNR